MEEHDQDLAPASRTPASAGGDGSRAPVSAPPPSFARASVPDQGASSPDSQEEEDPMALYEKELKENDWGHQPC